jgi:hypothetical protein
VATVDAIPVPVPPTPVISWRPTPRSSSEDPSNEATDDDPATSTTESPLEAPLERVQDSPHRPLEPKGNLNYH